MANKHDETKHDFQIVENFIKEHNGWNYTRLGLALGYGPSTMSGYKSKGKIPHTTFMALAGLKRQMSLNLESEANGTNGILDEPKKTEKKDPAPPVPPAPPQVQPRKKTVVLKGPAKTIDLLTELGTDQGCEVIEF